MDGVPACSIFGPAACLDTCGRHKMVLGGCNEMARSAASLHWVLACTGNPCLRRPPSHWSSSPLLSEMFFALLSVFLCCSVLFCSLYHCHHLPWGSSRPSGCNVEILDRGLESVFFGADLETNQNHEKTMKNCDATLKNH